MTIAELTGRIEERVRAALDEIARLQDARDALTAAPAPLAPTTVVAAPSANRRRARRAPAASPKRRVSDRRPTPAAVAALARELDAGLRTRI